jgi:hypothetical protein
VNSITRGKELEEEEELEELPSAEELEELVEGEEEVVPEGVEEVV